MAHFQRPLGPHTLTVVRAALVTDSSDNTSYRDWANATHTDYANNEVQPFLMSNRLSVEDNRYREYQSILHRVWAVPTMDVSYTDRVIFQGVTYDVVAQPEMWYYSDGSPSYQTFLLRLRRG